MRSIRKIIPAILAISLVPGAHAQIAEPRLFFNSDGSVNGAQVTTETGALFSPSGDVLASFKAWVRQQAGLLRLAPNPDERALAGLVPERNPIAEHGALTVHRFAQTYRGYPVIGPQERVSVLVAREDGRAVAFGGTVLDARINYAGLDRRIGESEAARAILDAWLAQGRPGEPRIDEVTLVAVPARRTLAYRGEVLIEGQAVAAVTVSAVDGSPLGHDDLRYEDAFDHRPVNVMAYQMANNPETTSLQFFPSRPGSTFGNVCQPSPPGFGCLLRMGNDRAAVYDFELDNNSAPRIWTTIEFAPHPNVIIPYAHFLENDDSTFRFKTQNVFHKLSAALAAGDAAKTVPGWDHHPNAPFSLFEAPPVSVFTNVDGTPAAGESDPCGGALGTASLYTFNNAWAPAEHPFITNQFKSAAITLCSQNEGVLFHELGHYYDIHSTFGTMGSGLVSSTCHWDTSDEAVPLRETIADLTAIYFYKKLYSSLPFDLSTTPSPCTFASLGQGGAAIHGGACTTSVGSFGSDRPDASNTEICDYRDGYKIRSIQQASWEYLSGRICRTSAPFTCSTFAADPDSFMEAMLLAEGVSNLQSYEQFFELMFLGLQLNEGTSKANTFRRIFAHHDILD